MEEQIGIDAGKVWEYLSANGGQKTKDIAKALALKEVEVERAVGWLAREGKLSFNVDAKKKTFTLSLK